MSLDTNDPRLTAYALGELDDAERAEVEALLNESPPARAAVAEIRQTAEMLTRGLAAEPVAVLTEQQRKAIDKAARGADGRLGASAVAKRRARRPRWVPYAIAASILILVGVPLGSLMLPSLSRARELSPETLANARARGLDYVGPGAEIGVLDAVNSIAIPAPRSSPQSSADPLDEQTLAELGALAYWSGDGPCPYAVDPVDTTATRSLWLFCMASKEGDVFGIAYDSEDGDHFADLRVQYRLEDGGPDTESYDPVVHNPFLATTENPLSTFSIDVDTASYANLRRFLNSGQLPPPGAVRIEEMVNYFEYDYPGPTTAEAAVPHPFSVNVDVAECPWVPEHRLMRVGLKGVEIEPEQRPVCNLVFLIDVSGSMGDENKLPLVKEALGLLTQELWDDDRMAMVVYADESELVLDSTTGRDRDAIFDALAHLDADGSTNGGEGIQLAYAVAEEHFIEGGVNRVILATDGDFNVGVTDQGELVRLIEEKAQGGVFLSVLGFGIDNLKDDTLEKLADKGNGNYAYIDTLNEARRVLVDQLSGTLATIAKDVKIQIEFNPAEIAGYRLIGYENRLLAAQDFNDDTKDAGEIGAGHTVTALYELVPQGLEVPDSRPPEVDASEDSRTGGFEESAEDDDNPATPPDPHAIAQNDALPNIAADETVDPLKYQTPGNLAATALGISDGEIATVKMRYKLPDGDTSILMEVPVIDGGATLDETSDDFRFAASVASFGMLLRGSPYAGGWTYDAVLQLASESVGADATGYRAEFVELVERARELAGE